MYRHTLMSANHHCSLGYQASETVCNACFLSRIFFSSFQGHFFFFSSFNCGLVPSLTILCSLPPSREKIDLNRVPPVLYEANCLESHSCTGIDSTLRLETIPITLRMPVLRKNPRCASFSLEFEPINIACICATSRQSGFLTDRF